MTHLFINIGVYVHVTINIPPNINLIGDVIFILKLTFMSIKELGLGSLKHGWAIVAKSAVCLENCGFPCSLMIICVPGKFLCTSPPYFLHKHKRSRFHMLLIREHWLGLES
jgi:hypothetical protein